MVHLPPSRSRDPPNSASGTPPRTKLTALRSDLSASAGTETTSAGVPGSQNAKNPKTRSDIEFHKTAHSFPEYGSVKGAVRMPPPFLKGLAPRRHVNTLDSGPNCLPKPHHAAEPGHVPAQPPPPKRQKQAVHTLARPRAPAEEIMDSEQDGISRTEHYGSQTSFAHSASPGVSEFQQVESKLKSERSDRRRRKSPGNRPLGILVHGKPGRAMGGEIIEDFDEMAPASRPPAHQRTARLVSIIRDPADEAILRKPSRPTQQHTGSSRGQKRSSNEITSDDGDELAKDINGRPLTQDSARREPPSLSRRGDLNPTRWTKRPDADCAEGVRVEAAVCHPNLRYLARDGQSPCFLRPTQDHELRAFTDDGSLAERYDWLKVTGKVKTLGYHPDANYIKINQAMDPASSIGGLMVLKFGNSADALLVADWARNHLAIQVVEEKESHKLLSTYDKVNQDVSLAATRTVARRPSVHEPVRPIRGMDGPRTAEVERPHGDSARARTSIRHSMQLSAKTSLPDKPESSTELSAAGLRALRSRRDNEQAQRFEGRRTPPVRRWTEEKPDWAKEWKIPLVFERATVDKEDIPRLDEGQCLNDNLIGFGLRYLFDKFRTRHDALRKRVYLHNSFFYEKLKSTRGNINYDGVKSWTAKVDLLSYDYIVVPVNEHFHWWVAIICNPGKLDPDARDVPTKAEGSSKEAHRKIDGASSDVEMTDVTEKRSSPSPELGPREPGLVKSDIVDLVSDDKNAGADLTSGARAKPLRKSGSAARRYDPKDPRIITLDSLGSTHPQAIAHLKKYLVAEFKDKRNKAISDVPQQLGMKATNIPEQNNLCDCGVYLLGYIQEFVQNPDLFIHTLLRRETPHWEFSPSNLRELWRDTILLEHKMYQEKQMGEMRKKREVSAAKQASSGSRESSSHQPQEPSGVTDLSGDKHKDQAVSSETPMSHKDKSTTTNPGVHRVGDSSAELVVQGQPEMTKRHTKPRSPRSHSSQQESLEEVVLLPPQEDSVLPSIEAPDFEELPGPPDKWQGEPKFLSKLPTSPIHGLDGSQLEEVDPKSFYRSTSTKSTSAQKRGALSSPAAGHRGRMTRSRPMYTTSSFAIVDGPVVEKAELVRHSDPIDLT